jgi:hypothetical protein
MQAKMRGLINNYQRAKLKLQNKDTLFSNIKA